MDDVVMNWAHCSLVCFSRNRHQEKIVSLSLSHTLVYDSSHGRVVVLVACPLFKELCIAGLVHNAVRELNIRSQNFRKYRYFLLDYFLDSSCWRTFSVDYDAAWFLIRVLFAIGRYSICACFSEDHWYCIFAST